MPGFKKREFIKSYFVELYVVNGGYLRMWGSNDPETPIVGFDIRPDGTIVAEIYDQQNGEVVHKLVIGTLGLLDPEEKTSFHVAKCKNNIFFLKHSKVVGKFSTVDLEFVEYFDAVDFGDEKNEIGFVGDTNIRACKDYEVLKWKMGDDNAQENDGFEWWIWLLIAIGILMVLLIVIFSAIAGTKTNISTTTTTFR